MGIDSYIDSIKIKSAQTHLFKEKGDEELFHKALLSNQATPQKGMEEIKHVIKAFITQANKPLYTNGDDDTKAVTNLISSKKETLLALPNAKQAAIVKKLLEDIPLDKEEKYSKIIKRIFNSSKNHRDIPSTHLQAASTKDPKTKPIGAWAALS